MAHSQADFSKEPLSDVIGALAVDPAKGLAVAEARARPAKYGVNALEEKRTSEPVGDWGDLAIMLGGYPAQVPRSRACEMPRVVSSP